MTKETIHVGIYDTWADWEAGFALAHLGSGDWQPDGRSYRIVTVAESLDPITTKGGLTLTPDITISELDPGKSAMLILPGADFAERNPESVDAQTVKTLLSVSRHASESGSVPPLAVAAVYDARKAEVARRAYGADSEIVSADEIISRLITQSVLQRGLCAVFSELLTLDEGNALYVRQLEGQAGTRFRDLSGTFPRAILLGTVRPGRPGARPRPRPRPRAGGGAAVQRRPNQ